LEETSLSKKQSPNNLFIKACEYAIDYNELPIEFGFLLANYWQAPGSPELNSKYESFFGFKTIPNMIGLNRILN
jgi:hypothetical protein